MSQQAARQAWFRAQAGVTSGSYTENIIQAYHALLSPVPNITVSEALAGLAKTATGVEQGNLPGDLHAWSQQTSPTPTNWSSAGDLSTAAYSPPATALDGITQSLTRGSAWVGATDQSKSMVSLWMYIDGASAGNRTFLGNDLSGSDSILLRLNSTGVILLQFLGSGLRFTSTAAPSTDVWHHLAISVDTAQPPGSKVFQVYMDGSAVAGTLVDTEPSSDIPWGTTTEWGVWCRDTGAERFDGCVSQYAIWYDERLDLSVPSELAKLYDSGPVDFGPTGTNPTGNQPLMYLINPAPDYADNEGTGGALVVTGGPLTACAGGGPT